MKLEAQDVMLRSYRDTDHEALVAILGDGEVVKLALLERALCLEDADQFVQADFSMTADGPPKKVLEGKDRLAMTSEEPIDIPGRGKRNVYVASQENLRLWASAHEA